MSFDTEDGGGAGGFGYGGGAGGAARRTPSAGNKGYQVEEQDREFMAKYQQIDSTLFKLNTNVVNLSKMVEKYDTKLDGHDLRQQFAQLQSATLQSLKTVEQNIKNLRPVTQKQRMQQDRLSKAMKSVLTQFQQCCETAMKKDKLSNDVDRARVKTTYRNDDDDEEREQSSLMAAHRREEEQRRFEQEQLHSQVQFNQDMILEREEGMKEIESTMLEINEIFRDLSIAVHDQGGMLDNIESNMTSADAHVESGTGQLVKASDYQKKARNKMMCLLVIVAVVAAILVIALVVTLK